MYFVAKGEDEISVMDQRGKSHQSRKILRPGDYFGEIAMVYETKRTATITSRKYGTLAKLTKPKYKELIIEYPEIINSLKEGIYKYNDKLKNFQLKSIDKIDFFQGIGEDAQHALIYNLKNEQK